MDKLIACCGLDCRTCPALQATVNDDDQLRRDTAGQWSAMFKAEIKPEDINCLGCRGEGPYFSHCRVCGIRACCAAKGWETCAPCPDLPCDQLQPVFAYTSSARDNLKSLA